MSDAVATTTVAFPSVLAPGLPAFTLEIPHGWNAGEFPDALMAVAAPEREGQFRPNLIVQGRRMPDSTLLGEVADAVVADLEGTYGDVAAGERRVNADEGAELFQQSLAYRLPGDGPALAHLNVLVLLHDEIAPGGFRSLLGVNAVCAQDEADQFLPIFQTMIRSFHVEKRQLSADGTALDRS